MQASEKEQYTLSELLTDLSNCQARQVHVVADQSYSGELRRLFRRSKSHKNVVVFSSSRDNQYSWGTDFTRVWTESNHTHTCAKHVFRVGFLCLPQGTIWSVANYRDHSQVCSGRYKSLKSWSAIDESLGYKETDPLFAGFQEADATFDTPDALGFRRRQHEHLWRPVWRRAAVHNARTTSELPGLPKSAHSPLGHQVYLRRRSDNGRPAATSNAWIAIWVQIQNSLAAVIALRFSLLLSCMVSLNYIYHSIRCDWLIIPDNCTESEITTWSQTWARYGPIPHSGVLFSCALPPPPKAKQLSIQKWCKKGGQVSNALQH